MKLEYIINNYWEIKILRIDNDPRTKYHSFVNPPANFSPYIVRNPFAILFKWMREKDAFYEKSCAQALRSPAN